MSRNRKRLDQEPLPADPAVVVDESAHALPGEAHDESSSSQPGRSGVFEPTVQQFVMFDVGAERFAFPMASVKEIIRVPDVVRVPLSPPTLEGLANLRGQVLPVLSLRRRFAFPDVEHNDATRVVVVVEHDNVMGFIVDRVASVSTVEPEQIERVEDGTTTVDSDVLTAMIKGVAGHTMVMVLDIARLVDFDASAFARSRSGQQAQAGVDEPRSGDGGLATERQLVSFVVAEQEYAFPIERVQEIVQVPELVSRVPNSPPHVLGVMTLRNRLLPLVSLRQMFGLPVLDLDAQHRIVVISLSGNDHQRTSAVVGIVMDAVNEVLRVPQRLVDALPTLLARNQTVSEIDAICRLDEGRRLVSILSVDKLFDHSMVRDAVTTLIEKEDAMQAHADDADELGADDEEQLVVFRLSGEEYGVAIDSVQEIIRVPDTLTRVPKTVHYLEGLVNLRGQVLPVVDLRKRFGLAEAVRDERQRVVVFSIGDVRTGFIVDSVSEVLKISKATIDAIPGLSDEQARLMGRVAKLEAQKRMILILEAGQLLSQQELHDLAAASRSAARTSAMAA